MPVMASLAPRQRSCLGIRHLQMFLLFLLVIIEIEFRMYLTTGLLFALLRIQWHDFSEYTTCFTIYHWTCMLAQLPIGYFVCMHNGSILNWAMRFCGILSLTVIILSKYLGLMTPYLLCGIAGVIQAVVPICTHGLLAAWTPPSERARLGTFVYGGESFGNMIITLIITFNQLNSNLYSAAILYLPAGMTFVWSLLYLTLGSESPSNHSCISEDEKGYIQESLRAENSEISYRTSIPFKQILTSPPVWAIVVAHCCQAWLQLILAIIPSLFAFQYPEYGMKIIWISYLSMWLISLIMGSLSNYAAKSGVSTATVRKICNTVGFCGPAIALAFLKHVRSEAWIIIFMIAMSLNAGSVCGFQINHIDLSPRYAGLLMSISNFFAFAVNLIAFYMFLDVIIIRWETMIYGTMGILIASNLIFVVYGKAKVQYWNN